MKIGTLSARYESAAAGEDAIGWDPAGEASYGSYQVATKVGTMLVFLNFCRDRSRYAPINEALRPLMSDITSKRGKFAAKWREIADPTDTGKGLEVILREAEHEFIMATHYQPALAKLPVAARAIIESSPTLQQVLWSTCVQHRASTVQIIFSAVCLPGKPKEQIIREVYDARQHRLGGLPPRMKANIINNRYIPECKRALDMLTTEG
jgi:hypothetical protein